MSTRWAARVGAVYALQVKNLQFAVAVDGANESLRPWRMVSRSLKLEGRCLSGPRSRRLAFSLVD